jgi:hypothetical protein
MGKKTIYNPLLEEGFQEVYVAPDTFTANDTSLNLLSKEPLFQHLRKLDNNLDYTSTNQIVTKIENGVETNLIDTKFLDPTSAWVEDYPFVNTNNWIQTTSDLTLIYRRRVLFSQPFRSLTLEYNDAFDQNSGITGFFTLTDFTAGFALNAFYGADTRFIDVNLGNGIFRIVVVKNTDNSLSIVSTNLASTVFGSIKNVFINGLPCDPIKPTYNEEVDTDIKPINITTNQTRLSAGYYDLNGTINISLRDEVGVWIFDNSANNWATNPATFTRNALETYKVEGVDTIAPFIADVSGKSFKIIKTEVGGAFKVYAENTPTVPATFTPNGGWNPTTQATFFNTATNKVNGNSFFVYRVTGTATLDLGQGSQLFENGGEIKWFSASVYTYLSPQQAATVSNFQEIRTGNVPLVLVNPTIPALPVSGAQTIVRYDDAVQISTFDGVSWNNVRVFIQPTATQLSYWEGRLAANTLIAQNNAFPLTQTEIVGTNITYNSPNITLAPNGTYLLRAFGDATGTQGNGGYDFQWRNNAVGLIAGSNGFCNVDGVARITRWGTTTITTGATAVVVRLDSIEATTSTYSSFTYVQITQLR